MRIFSLLLFSMLGLAACEPVTLGGPLKDPVERSTPAGRIQARLLIGWP